MECDTDVEVDDKDEDENDGDYIFTHSSKAHFNPKQSLINMAVHSNKIQCCEKVFDSAGALQTF